MTLLLDVEKPQNVKVGTISREQASTSRNPRVQEVSERLKGSKVGKTFAYYEVHTKVKPVSIW